MAIRFLPREFQFFDMFDNLANQSILAAEFLSTHVQTALFNDPELEKIRDIEHAADDITHDIIRKLNKTFITPFDREDIHALAHEMDNVIDMIFALSKRMNIYKINERSESLIKFAEIISNSVVALTKAVNLLRELKKPDLIMNYCIEVNRLENEGDVLRNSVIADLFENCHDPIYIMKWKEIFEDAETTLDKCEDVANIVESILVKQA